MKGGVGKTTTAIHLAYWLAVEKKWNVVLCDDDRNRSVLKWEARAKGSGFDVPFIVTSLAKVAKAAKSAEIVIVDTQASIDDETLSDLAEDCDLVIVPTKPDIDSLAAAVETVDMIKSQQGSCRILLTDCPTGSSKAGERVEAELVKRGYPVLQQRIRRGAGVSHASLEGATLVQQSGNYRLPWLDYQKAFTEIYEVINGKD